MIVTSEFDEINYGTITGIGQSSFITPGTFSWTVPTSITSISVVTVGGGGGGGGDNSALTGKGGGGGGALAYVNNIAVTPGETLTVGVGTSGQPGIVAPSAASNGGNSFVKRGATSLVEAGGGKRGNSASTDANVNGGIGGVVIVGTGGNGGNGGAGDAGGGGGGGGAGGYSGAGGAGGAGGNGTGSNGSGGGGGGSSGGNAVSYGGGGVGILGQGQNGTGGSGAGAGASGNGGSGGENGTNQATGGGSLLIGGGKFGGGGGGGTDSPAGLGNVGGGGAVRIIWGTNRQFPATGTVDLTGAYAGISGLGTYTALEFKENIGTATTIQANVFAPYQIVDDEFAGVLFGPGQGTFMRQEVTGSVIVYNEIDEVGLSTSYTIAQQSLSIDEGGMVTFEINATNVPDGTEIFYEII